MKKIFFKPFLSLFLLPVFFSMPAWSGQISVSVQGDFRKNGISGCCFNDANQNGIMDEDEKGIEGILISFRKLNVSLMTANTGAAITDKNGRYVFSGLKKGIYRVNAGYADNELTTSNPVLSTLGLFENNCEVNFGIIEVITHPPSQAKQLAELLPVPDCEELVTRLKEQAVLDMEAQIDSNAAELSACGECCYYIYELGGWPVPALPAPVDDAGDGSGGSGNDGASEYSETNNQVAGVDEADFIKNDGSYIYILADNRFQIIDAWPPDNASIISRTEIEGTPKKLFLTSDRALIYSSLDYIGRTDPYPYYYDSYMGAESECTYGYNCDFTGDNRKLKITIYDISDRTSPKLLREIRFSGSYINARRIGTAVHSAILSPVFLSPNIKYWPEILKKCGYSSEQEPTLKEILTAFEALKEKNREIINNSASIDWLPAIQDTVYTGEESVTSEGVFLDCNNVYESAQDDSESFLTILSLDIDKIEDLNQTTIFGRPGAVYASSSALYVSARQQYSSGYPWYYDTNYEIREASTIHKFRLTSNPAGCEYSGSGVVKGRVLNQFAMDEFEGYLRIATTTGHVPGPNVHSTLSVLKENSEGLGVVGQVDNIAPTEDVRSVRFNGTRAFIVTFKKTDPLFAFDLSDPEAPRVAGELKIPGYSTYMHLMDEEHLLTIGYDADDQGDFAWFQGLLLQIFDVSEMSEPKLIHKEVIGTRGSTSEAATNHLAFNYFAPKDLLAIPITICEGGSGGGYYGTEMTFSGLLIYDVTVKDGFKKKGGVPHVEPGSENSWNACSNWWTNSNSVVKRSIFMDDYVYSVALDRIKVESLDNLGHDVSVIEIIE